MDKIKLKGTGLERNVKVSNSLIKEIRRLRAEDYTYQEIAEVVNLSNTAVRYHCLSDADRETIKESNRARKKRWYHNKSVDERRAMSKKWRESIAKYQSELIDTRINNM